MLTIPANPPGKMKQSNDAPPPPPYNTPSAGPTNDPDEPIIELVNQQPARQPLMEEHGRRLQRQLATWDPARATTTTAMRTTNPYHPAGGRPGRRDSTPHSANQTLACTVCGSNPACIECRCVAAPCDLCDCCCGVFFCAVLIGFVAAVWYVIHWTAGVLSRGFPRA
jgi:hypothetical protein